MATDLAILGAGKVIEEQIIYISTTVIEIWGSLRSPKLAVNTSLQSIKAIPTASEEAMIKIVVGINMYKEEESTREDVEHRTMENYIWIFRTN